MVQMALNEIVCNGVETSPPTPNTQSPICQLSPEKSGPERPSDRCDDSAPLDPSPPEPEVENHDEELTSEGHDCLKHPSFEEQSRRLEESLNRISTLEDSIRSLEAQLARGQENAEKVSELEEIIRRQEKHLDLCQKERDLDARTIEALKNELELKMSALKKQCESANKDKENMIVRYAMSEKELLDQKKNLLVIEKKLKDAIKESENLGNKVKTLSAEKTKLAQSLDSKTSEVATAYKEIDKLKEEINSRDIKIKWTQNKLKSELEAHKDCPVEIEKMQNTVDDLKKEVDGLFEENASLKRQLEGSEINKNLESRLKELSSKVEEETKAKLELEALYDSVVCKNQNLTDENSELSFLVQCLEQDKEDLKRTISQLSEENETLSQAVNELKEELREYDDIKIKINEEKAAKKALVEEIERLTSSNSELSVDMSVCRNREGEMLSLTEQLTAKNAEIQAKFLGLESEINDLKSENSQLYSEKTRLSDATSRLEEDFQKEKLRRLEETKLLAREAAEQKTKAQQLEASLVEAQAELTLLRNKHATALKELQRELKNCRKKIDEYETSLNNSASLVNGTGSCSSTSSPASSLTSLNNDNGTSSGGISCQILDVPAQALVERIVKLQNECAKQNERIEFLEDHSERLVKKLQKKTRLLQNYIMREPTGALTSKSMDKNKAEVSKHGGIMASLYSSNKPADESMSLELCLEINRKLQAVLEDTLLKNITLKENLDTLGDEIARLSKEGK